MRNKMTLRVALLCCGASVAGMPSVVFSQTDRVSNLDPEIIVTAMRRNEALKDVAMSVNVATGEDIQQLNIFDAKDVQQLAPGLEMTNSNGRTNVTTLRGITFDPDQGSGPAVQIYLNEAPIDAQTVFTAIYDVQQVEVLRGPQGLLRGLSAPAGAITFTTRKPNFDETEGFAQATVTTRAGYNVQGGVSLPFSEKVSLRLAAVMDGNRLNHVRNVTRGDRSRSRTQSVRATLGLQPNENFTAYLTYQYLTSDARQYAQVFGTGNTPSYELFPYFGGFLVPDTSEVSGPPLALRDRAAVSEGIQRFQNNTHIVNLQANYDLGAATLSFVGAHQETILDQDRDTDGGNAVVGWQNRQIAKIPYNVDTAELRLESNNDEGFGWGVGAFYSAQSGTTQVRQQADNFFFPTSVTTTPLLAGDLPYLPVDTHIRVPVQVEIWSFNANARFKSGPLKIEGGLRYSIIENRQQAFITGSSPGNFLGGVLPFEFEQDGVPPELQNSKDRPWTGGVNITYEVAPDFNLYAAYGHSFRSGSAGVAVPVGISSDLIRTGPEKTDSYEIGFKGTGFSRRINFSLAAFYQKIDGHLSRFTSIAYNCPELDRVCSADEDAPPIDNVNDENLTNGAFDFNYNGDATIKGVEATIDGRMTNNWDLGFSASYIKARYDNAVLPCNDYAGTGRPNATGTPRITGTGNVSYCASNGRLSDTPNFSLTANTEMRFPMGDMTPYVRALFNYRPGVYSERDNFDYRHRELLNLFVGLRHDNAGWDINLFARNLLGQDRVIDIADGEAVQGTAARVSYESGYRLVNLQNPREFGLTASFKF